MQFTSARVATLVSLKPAHLAGADGSLEVSGIS